MIPNIDRFPNDFAFVLIASEWQELGLLRSQNATLKRGGHRKHLPRVFAEYGALMAANVLRNPQAVEMSVFVEAHLEATTEDRAFLRHGACSRLWNSVPECVE